MSSGWELTAETKIYQRLPLATCIPSPRISVCINNLSHGEGRYYSSGSPTHTRSPPLTQRLAKPFLAISLLRKPMESQHSRMRGCGLGDSPQRSPRNPFQVTQCVLSQGPCGQMPALDVVRNDPPDRSSLDEKGKTQPPWLCPLTETYKAIEMKNRARAQQGACRVENPSAGGGLQGA